MSNAKTSLLREQVKRAAGVLASTMEDIPEEAAHWAPGGRANSIAANFGHVTTAVDGVVNGLLKGEAPLMMSKATGLSEPPPMDDERFDWHGWGKRLRIDLDESRRYLDAVMKSVDSYLAGLSDSDLERVITTPLGERSVFDMLNGAVLFNLNCHTGEIAALKGQQGMKGYAF